MKKAFETTVATMQEQFTKLLEVQPSLYFFFLIPTVASQAQNARIAKLESSLVEKGMGTTLMFSPPDVARVRHQSGVEDSRVQAAVQGAIPHE